MILAHVLCLDVSEVDFVGGRRKVSFSKHVKHLGGIAISRICCKFSLKMVKLKGKKMLISVAMPTYKRLPQLKRAVDDVMSQTWHDWELVISDDEEGEGETWKWLRDLATKDSRVRVLKNTRGKHGQIYNVNSACMATSGEWIKPFFDDDRMLPNCLEEFAKIVLSEIIQRNNVVLIGCRAQLWRNGVHVGDERNFIKHSMEVIPPPDALRAYCLLDSRNGRTPTHMLMRGDVVRSGIGMVEDAKFKHPLDVRRYGRLLEHGGYAMTEKVLVGECQGEVESGTSELWKEEPFVSEESRRVYHEIWERNHDPSWSSHRAVDGLICGVRALYHLKLHQWASACHYLPLMFKSLISPYLVARWLLRKRFPGRFLATERVFVK